jgi:hypothetical protein
VKSEIFSIEVIEKGGEEWKGGETKLKRMM